MASKEVASAVALLKKAGATRDNLKGHERERAEKLIRDFTVACQLARSIVPNRAAYWANKRDDHRIDLMHLIEHGIVPSKHPAAEKDEWQDDAKFPKTPDPI